MKEGDDGVNKNTRSQRGTEHRASRTTRPLHASKSRTTSGEINSRVRLLANTICTAAALIPRTWPSFGPGLLFADGEIGIVVDGEASIEGSTGNLVGGTTGP